MFISAMINKLKAEDDFPTVVSSAYADTIKQYHSFFIKSMFSVSLQRPQLKIALLEAI